MATTAQGPKRSPPGQHHLMYKNQTKQTSSNSAGEGTIVPASPLASPTRLVVRRNSMRNDGEGVHIFAIRYPADVKDLFVSEQAMPMTSSTTQEQCPPRTTKATAATGPSNNTTPAPNKTKIASELKAEVFTPTTILQAPSQPGTLHE